MSNFHILAFETSSNFCGAALLSCLEGHDHMRSLGHEGRSEHAERILPLAESLLAQANIPRGDLSAIAFGQGPGGFTGLRVACGVAQGLAMALDIPVIAVDSMRAVALQSAGARPGVHVVLQDARMSEVYAAAYRQGADSEWQTLQSPALLRLPDVAPWLEREAPAWDAAGGVQCAHGDALAAFSELGAAVRGAGFQLDQQADQGQARAQAATVARLAAQDWLAGRTSAPEDVAPAYIRNKVAYTTHERAAGQGGNPQALADARSLHPMVDSDLDEVAAIERRVQSFPWTRGHFADALAAGYHGWVVRHLGGMQGFALLMDAPDMAHLLVIGVRPDHQRQGVGEALLARCISHCRAVGLPALTLEVRPSNRQAIAFYLKAGFGHVGTRKAYYPTGHAVREDAWIMTLDLAP